MENNNDKDHYSVTGILNLTMSEPYYLFNFLVFFSYIPIRFSASSVLSPHFTSHLLHREIQAFLAFCIFAAVTFWNTALAKDGDVELQQLSLSVRNISG